MLVGVKTWAVAHLISNGDLGSIVLFGSVLAWAVYDRITLKRRTDPGAPPFPVGGRRNDIIALVVGTLLISRSARLPSPRGRDSGFRPAGVLGSSPCRSRRDQAADRASTSAPARAASRSSRLTSYHAHTARLLDRPLRSHSGRRLARHGDARLETTVPVTLDMMILQGHAVMRGSKRALVVVDMPFGSYEASRSRPSCRRRG
jgi:hypothetical protein